MTVIYCTPLENNAYPLEIVIDRKDISATYKGVSNPAKIDLKEIQRDSNKIVFEEYINGTAGGRYYWKDQSSYDGLFSNGELIYKNNSHEIKFLTENFVPTVEYVSLSDAEDTLDQRITEKKLYEAEHGNPEYAFMQYRWEYNDLSILLHQCPGSIEYPFHKLTKDGTWKIAESDDGMLRFYYNDFMLERKYYCPQVIAQYKTTNQVVAINQYEHSLFKESKLDYDWWAIDTIYIQRIKDTDGDYYLTEVVPQGKVMGSFNSGTTPKESIIYLYKIENGKLSKKEIISGRTSLNVIYSESDVMHPIFKYDETNKTLVFPETNLVAPALAKIN